MLKTISAYFLPMLVEPQQFAGGDVVVIDILRASTTITFALAAGAKCVVPCLEVEQAQALAKKLPAERRILGGERGGLAIPGFDCGNSPDEYRPENIGGKTVIFTTTNGTRAMMQCRQAARVWIGSFVNFTAVCSQLAQAEQVHLLCAGTQGEITREDVLFAGAVVARLVSDTIPLNDQARIAWNAWRGLFYGDLPLTERDLQEQLLQTQGGRNLQRIGLASDVAAVARLDCFDFVPRLDVAAWRIVRP